MVAHLVTRPVDRHGKALRVGDIVRAYFLDNKVEFAILVDILYGSLAVLELGSGVCVDTGLDHVELHRPQWPTLSKVT